MAGKVIAAGLGSDSYVEPSPFKGRRIILLRALAQAEEWRDTFCRLGADVLCIPLLSFEPVEEETVKITSSFLKPFTRIIFTSTNGVIFFFEALFQANGGAVDLQGKQVVCIGSKTASQLKSFGICPMKVPRQFSSDGLLMDLPQDLRNESILIPTAQGAYPKLPNVLKARGAAVRVLKIYKTLAVEPPKMQLRDGDWVVFTSPSTADHFFSCKIYTKQTIIPFAIGRVTQEAVQRHFKGEVAVAEEASLAGMVNVMNSYNLGMTNEISACTDAAITR